MKILATGMGWIEHTPGGLNRYFADYMKAMSNKGHIVHGLMTVSGESTVVPDYIQDVVLQSGNAGTLSRAKAFRDQVKREMASNRPDLFNPHFGLYASLVTKKLIPRDLPVVTHFHGPWARESMAEDKGGAISRWIRYQMKKQVESLAYRRSHHFIVLSEYFRDVLAEEYNVASDRIHVIPGAVDTERFHPSFHRRELKRFLKVEEDKILLFCARRLVNRMGIDQLIVAMSQVTRWTEDLVLYIAGSGPQQARLQALITELGLGNSVHLLGRVSNDKLVQWYQAADISVVPSAELEGFGLASVEALACGTPVLGTPLGGTREILPGLSPDLLFDNSTPQAMSHKLLSIWSTNTVLPSREACRRYALEHYTWEKVTTGITDVFRQAIQEKSAVAMEKTKKTWATGG